MNAAQREWLTDFARKLQESAKRAEDKDAKAILVGKAGTACFILEKLEKLK